MFIIRKEVPATGIKAGDTIGFNSNTRMGVVGRATAARDEAGRRRVQLALEDGVILNFAGGDLVHLIRRGGLAPTEA